MKRQAPRPPDRLSPYVDLVASFVEGSMPATEFEQRYFERFKNDLTHWDDDEFWVLERLFSDPDVFEPDPAVRAELGFETIDEAELRPCATDALRKLHDLETREQA